MAAARSAAGSPLVGHRPLEAPEPSRSLCCSVTFLPKQQRRNRCLSTWVACRTTPGAPGCPPPPSQESGCRRGARRARGASGGRAQHPVLPAGELLGGVLRRVLSVVCALQGPPCLCRRNGRPWSRSAGSRRAWSGASARRTAEDGSRWAIHAGQLSSPGRCGPRSQCPLVREVAGVWRSCQVR